MGLNIFCCGDDARTTLLNQLSDTGSKNPERMGVTELPFCEDFQDVGRKASFLAEHVDHLAVELDAINSSANAHFNRVKHPVILSFHRQATTSFSLGLLLIGVLSACSYMTTKTEMGEQVGRGTDHPSSQETPNGSGLIAGIVLSCMGIVACGVWFCVAINIYLSQRGYYLNISVTGEPDFTTHSAVARLVRLEKLVQAHEVAVLDVEAADEDLVATRNHEAYTAKRTDLGQRLERLKAAYGARKDYAVPLQARVAQHAAVEYAEGATATAGSTLLSYVAPRDSAALEGGYGAVPVSRSRQPRSRFTPVDNGKYNTATVAIREHQGLQDSVHFEHEASAPEANPLVSL